MSKEYGHPVDEQERWRYAYILAGPGGILRDLEGHVRGMDLEDAADFPNDLQGHPFAEVVARVRAAVDVP